MCLSVSERGETVYLLFPATEIPQVDQVDESNRNHVYVGETDLGRLGRPCRPCCLGRLGACRGGVFGGPIIPPAAAFTSPPPRGGESPLHFDPIRCEQRIHF